MEDYVDSLDRGDFIPAPGFGCMGCEFLGNCKRWEGGR
jgi:putative RecB family exonuclease